MPAANPARAPAKSAAEPPSETPMTWVIVERAPRTAVELPRGADLVLEDERPLLPSTLALHKRFAKDDNATTIYVISVDPSGLCLICLDKDGEEVQYLLCDARTSKTTLLPSCADLGVSRGHTRRGTRPAPSISQGFRPPATGLIGNRARDGDYILAELPAGGTHYKTMLCYSTWVDTRHGLLATDLSVDRPDLCYVALPEPDEDIECGSEDHRKHRCLNVSQGALRFLEIRNASGDTRIVMWTHNNDPCARSVWRREYDLLLKDLWADKSYGAAGLQNKLPTLISLVNPTNVPLSMCSGTCHWWRLTCKQQKTVYWASRYTGHSPFWHGSPCCGSVLVSPSSNNPMYLLILDS
jgi:hypothetical protein